jgi:hypothetical protein
MGKTLVLTWRTDPRGQTPPTYRRSNSNSSGIITPDIGG